MPGAPHKSGVPFFCGREIETELITATLPTCRVSVLHGPSGVGKTSILQVGVLPALRKTPAIFPFVYRHWVERDALGALGREIAAAFSGHGIEPPLPGQLFSDFLRDISARV